MKQCPSFPGYSATDNGQIISHRRRGCGKQRGSVSTIDPSYRYELSQQSTQKGYRTVGIVLPSGKKRPVCVHRLVADAFYGPCPDGLQVRHLNGDPSDNSPSNLKYGTQLENANDRREHGTYVNGGKHHGAKLSNEQAFSVRQLRESGKKVKDIATAFSVSVSTVECIIYGKSYKTEADHANPS